MRFEGTADYVATDDLKVAVNAAATLRRPLLVKGEPGTGKTVLAHEIAATFDAPLIEWHVKSTTKAHQGLYEYDAVARLRDGQLGDPRVHEIRNYIRKGKLWDAFTSPRLPVLLIDEIDKADIEFPNDLLQELDRMSFDVYETGETITALERPIVVITSNNEKELPDAFLRRCFFHYIRFPDRETMEKIVHTHYPDIKAALAREALNVFFRIRDLPGLKKKPATVHQRADRLAEAAAARGHAARGAPEPRRHQGDPAARGRAAEERGGRDAVRAAGVHGAAPGALLTARRAARTARRATPARLPRVNIY